MELVYLWVEKYKNIRRQGFNFSPRVKCEFHAKYKKDEAGKEILENNCELVIKPKEHLENFFGENINVTAIVGENGSGKSSIFEILSKINNKDTLENYILVINENKNDIPIYITNIKSEIKTTLDKKEISGIDYKLHYFNNLYTYNKNDYFNNTLNISLDVRTIVNIFINLKEKDDKFNISLFMYIPIKIEITLQDLDITLAKTLENDSVKNQEEIKNIFSTSESYHKCLIIMYIRNNPNITNIDILKDIISLENSEYPEDIFRNNVLPFTETKTIELSQLDNELYIEEDSLYYFFDFDLIDKDDKKYNDLSHGERTLFGQLLNIYFYTLQSNDLLFLFDEPEISFHPQWQKKYIKEVQLLFSQLEKNIHFIFTTHSPFLLSDLPKENVIFLEKDKKTGNCINSTQDITINPFGANIHTLLSHGFFMEDGLMGEFAKNKINEIIDFLNIEETIEKISTSQNQIKIKKVIENIGEEFLREKLILMYNKKFPKSKDEQIIELQKKIIELRKND